MEKGYQKTIYACFIGYIVQAIVNNFVPLLFVTFHDSYGIPLSKITLLVTFNFGLQLLVDLLSVGFVDRIGYRASMLLAHGLSAVGLFLLPVLPGLFADPFAGLLIAILIYAVGGGLLEVLISPVVESCPTDNKEKAMSLLHSFYCWGQVGVVLVSTLFFAVFGIQNWKLLAMLWAVIPVLNGLFFIGVPIALLIEDGETGMKLGELLKNGLFWILFLMMLCAGASEQAVSQWASALAERGLGISKTLGDLTGPMTFGILMGISRAFYGKYGDKIRLERFMGASALLCIASYLLIALVPVPALGLVGCALCGLSVGIMWPGTFSMAAASMRHGGTALFALLALAGDLGCSSGPTLAGFVSGVYGDNLRRGILAAVIFPIALLVSLLLIKRRRSVEG